MNNDFPDDLKAFAAQRCPQGVLAFYQEVMPAYVGTCEEMGWAAPTAIAVILDDIGTYGVIDCVKLDGRWRQKNGCMGLFVRSLLASLKERHSEIRMLSQCLRDVGSAMVEDFADNEQAEIPPLPLYQELGIDD